MASPSPRLAHWPWRLPTPNVIYAGTGESDIRSDLCSGDGVYKSPDGGATWKNIGLRDSRQISRIVVDPHNADIVYVGALGHAYGPNDERGVYKSTDGGKTWTHVLDKGPSIGVSDLAMATAAPNILFAGTWNAHRPPWSTYAPLQGPGGGLYRSTDSGATWTQLTGHGLPDGDWGRVGVAVAPDGKRVYALIDAGKKSGLYRSDDGGDTWTLANSDPRLTSRAWYFNWITVDPNNPDVIYIPNVALYRSEDGGKTISIVRGAPGGDDYHQLWVDPKNSSRMILGTDQGTTISLNDGKTWSSWFNQPTGQFYHVITDNEFPYHVYGAQQDSGSAAVAEPHRSRADHRARLVHGGRRRKRMAGSRSQRSQHPLCHRRLWQRGALGPPHLVEPGHHSVARLTTSAARSTSASIAIRGRRCWSSRRWRRTRSISERST